MDQINVLRKQIDHIDDQIMELLDQRYALTTQIGVLKKEQNIKILHNDRESFILDKASNFSHYPQIVNIYKTIMDESKQLQRK